MCALGSIALENAEVMQRFLAMLPDGAEILTPYGSTECLPVACISSRQVLGGTAAATDAGAGVCVGAPVPSIDLRIIRIDDAPIEKWSDEWVLGPGEIGEITVRGPQATRAYYNRPEATALAKIADADGSVIIPCSLLVSQDCGQAFNAFRQWYVRPFRSEKPAPVSPM